MRACISFFFNISYVVTFLLFCYWRTASLQWSSVVLFQSRNNSMWTWLMVHLQNKRHTCIRCFCSFLCAANSSPRQEAESSHSVLHCTSAGLPDSAAWHHEQCLWVACQTLDLLYQAGNLTRQLFSCLLAPPLVMDFLNERLSFSRFHTSARSAGPPSRSHAPPLTLISQGKWSIGPKRGQHRQESGLRSLILYMLM